MDEFFEEVRKHLQGQDVVYLNVKVIPKAQKTEAVELLEGADDEQVLKVKVAAVPEKGKANRALCAYLSKFFGVSQSSVEVVRGQTGQRKVLKIIAGPCRMP